MKKAYLKVFLFVIIIISLTLNLYMQELNWPSNWDKALKDAKVKGKRVYFLFHTDWCPHCKRLIKETLSSKKVIDFFKKENFILIHTNPEKDKLAEKTFKVYGYPTAIVFNESGEEIDRIFGFTTPDNLIKKIKNYLKGKDTLNELLKKEKSYPKNLNILYKIARKYMAKGEFESSIKYLDKIIKFDINNKNAMASKALSFKGYVYYKWKKYKKAGDTLIELTEKYPFSNELEDSYLRAAYYYEKGGFLKDALSAYKKYIETFPEKKDNVISSIKKLEKRIKE